MKHHRFQFPGEALLAATLFLPVRLDDPKSKQGEAPLPLPALGGKADDPHAEMRKLFGKIEKDLRQIDRLLADASAGPGAGGTTESKSGTTESNSGTTESKSGTAESKSATAAAKSSAAVEGIEKLLSSSEERGKSVLDSIDRILELAKHDPSSSSSSCESTGGMCNNSKSGGSSKNNSKGNSGASQKPGDDQAGGRGLLDRQGGTSTQREATPEGPDQPGAPKGGQQPGQKDPAQESQAQNGTKPAGNQSSKTPAENAAADPNGDAKGGDPRSASAAGDKWGDLPLHVRDVFRTQGGGDMPAQYRDWIDAYYRRMAKKAGS